MTRVADLWQVNSFRRAALLLLAYPAPILDALASVEDLTSPPLPRDVTDPADWEDATAALRTLYGVSRIEGAEAVLADVASLVRKEPEFERYSEGVARLPGLLSERDSFDRRQLYRQAREMLLPQLVESEIGLTLRAVETSHGIEVVPIVVARLELDEPLPGGSGTIRLSLPLDAMIELAAGLLEVRDTYASLESMLPAGVLKPEARLEWPDMDETE